MIDDEDDKGRDDKKATDREHDGLGDMVTDEGAGDEGE